MGELTRFYAGIGSRTTPTEILDLMTRVATRLNGLGYTLRSGGADGADTAFASGAGDRLQEFLPWRGFNGNTSSLHTVGGDALELASRVHPAFSRLGRPARLLMARNCYQVLGATLDDPVDFVLCWTPDGAETEAERTKATGGTGQAIALASRHAIPVFNLQRPGRLDLLAQLLQQRQPVNPDPTTSRT